jgi:hypothetical protein
VADGNGFHAPLAQLLYLPLFVAGRAQLRPGRRGRGLPRRVFARSPLAREPRYVDFESPSLCRALKRFALEGVIDFEEMLAAPEDCWLESDAGHHTSELRVVALGRSRP